MKSTNEIIADRYLPGLTRPVLPLRTQSGSVKCSMGRERSARGGLVYLRIGSVNMTTMRRRDGEVVSMAARSRLDFCCRQETEWSGEGAEGWGVQVLLDGL